MYFLIDFENVGSEGLKGAEYHGGHRRYCDHFFQPGLRADPPGMSSSDYGIFLPAGYM